MKNNIIGAVEIGTSKVAALIGEVTDGNGLRIIGRGLSTSTGVHKGEIVDTNAVSECTHNALAAAEADAGIQIEGVHLAISGDHLKTFPCAGSVSIGSPGNAVHADENKICDLLHVINAYGLNVEDVTLSSIAAGALLTHETERQQGVMVMDIGLYQNGRVVRTGVIATGGGLSIPPFFTPQTVNTRFRPLFMILKKQLGNRICPHHLPCGIILSGGASRTPGICDLATGILGIQTRCGEIPAFVTDPELRQPEYATVLGLLCYAMHGQKDELA